MNANPFHGPQESLPLFIYRFVRTQSEADIQRGYAGALVLLILILSLFIVARIIGRDRSVANKRPIRLRLPSRSSAQERAEPRLIASTSGRSATVMPAGGS
jgi:phosphate transport system permease protein